MRNPESREPFLECERCQKEKDVLSLGDNPSIGGGDVGAQGGGF
jgi:hypothetical protein